MLNALQVDIRRYLMTKSYIVLSAIIGILQPLALCVMVLGLSWTMNAEPFVTLNEISGYSSTASIYLAVLVTFFLHAEAGEGIIRNKVISGKKRHEILFSYSLVMAMVALLLEIVSVVVVVVAAKMMGITFLIATEEIIRFTLVNSLAGVAVSIFYTMLYMCFCTSKAAIALPGSVAVVMKIAMIVILDALYTPSGVPKVTGVTLKVFEAFDRYCAFSHLNGELRWDNASYLVGNLVVIVISFLIGIVVFSKKDLK